MSNSSLIDLATRPENRVSEPRRESPLHHVSHPNVKDAGVVLKEMAFAVHITLRGDGSNEAFVAGVEKALGVSLPVGPLTSASAESCHVFWIGPSEWLIVAFDSDAAGIESGLRNELTGHFSVVDVSGGQTLLALSGDQAILVLKKSCGYDIEGALPVGKVVTTGFAKATVVLHHHCDGVYWLVVRRSFADYVWRWLDDASAEYGLALDN